MKILNEQELKEKLIEKVSENHQLAIELEQSSSHKKISDTEKAIEKYLLTMLARREYSSFELRNKLKEKAFDADLSEYVLKKFTEEGQQSDQRFCDMFIRSRILKQSGPFKIRMELNAKGVSAAIISQGLSQVECDWFELALAAAKKKTALWRQFEFEDKAKLMRFLQGKGFEQEQIRYAVESLDFNTRAAGGC